MKNKILILLTGILCTILLSGCSSDRKYIDDLVPGKLLTAQMVSKARGKVPMEIYLPPHWDKEKVNGYPLIIFLHGQGGDQHYFFDNIDYPQFNTLITNHEIPPFVLVSLASDYSFGNEQQWSTKRNEKFLTSENDRELRAYCRQNFNAGLSSGTISIHGHSRGARGALHYAFKFSDKFASAMSNAFVSDYALEEEKENAIENASDIKASGIKIRMVIGTDDEWVVDLDRQASYIMHDHLDSLNIEHEFEVLEGADHHLDNIWEALNKSGTSNGVYEFKLHAEAWNKK